QIRELKVARLLEPSTRDAEVHDMVTWLEEQYPRGKDALVYTSGGVVTGGSAEESLQVSQTVSAAMVDVAQRLSTPPRYVIAKGGITSHDPAPQAFRVHRAHA